MARYETILEVAIGLFRQMLNERLEEKGKTLTCEALTTAAEDDLKSSDDIVAFDVAESVRLWTWLDRISWAGCRLTWAECA